MKKHRFKRLEIAEYSDGFRFHNWYLDNADTVNEGGLDFYQLKQKLLEWLAAHEPDSFELKKQIDKLLMGIK